MCVHVCEVSVGVDLLSFISALVQGNGRPVWLIDWLGICHLGNGRSAETRQGRCSRRDKPHRLAACPFVSLGTVTVFNELNESFTCLHMPLSCVTQAVSFTGLANVKDTCPCCWPLTRVLCSVFSVLSLLLSEAIHTVATFKWNVHRAHSEQTCVP